MQTATVEVKYVNPPQDDKQYGSIKDLAGVVWPVKRDRIHEFEEGGAYQIAYTETKTGFKNIVGVKHIEAEIEAEPLLPAGDFVKVPPAPRMAQAAKAPAPQPNKAAVKDYYRPTAPRDSERMFTCALAGHWIDTGRVEMTEEAMTDLVRSLRRVYAATFGADDQA